MIDGLSLLKIPFLKLLENEINLLAFSSNTTTIQKHLSVEQKL